ncbi:PTS sugar transporter subunit IIA [Paenibacillus sp. 8b26]|uniref:PTS sugar transporter subunit IIA n=1 Tax=Paenibacillus sp. 8b26 TaxID=3424133 RepID=UPI003D64985F
MNIDIVVNNADENVKTYSDAIRFTGKFLVENEDIDPKYIDACIDREKDFPTGLLFANDVGIAIPHGSSDFVKKDSISVLRAVNNIEFGKMEDKSEKVDCKLLFHLALSSGKQHIRVLRKLVGLFQDEEFIASCQTFEVEETEKYIAKRLAE